MFETILFPVDFSKRCEACATSVGAYARQFHAQVILLHLVEMPDYLFGMPEYSVVSYTQIRDEQMAERRKKLESWNPPGLQNVAARRVIAEGDPGREIVRYAQEHDARLIMMPSHGFGPFRRFMIGSTTAKVLHDAHLPVWTDAHSPEGDGSGAAAPPAPPVSGKTAIRQILCAIDLGPQSENALEMASSLSTETGAEVLVVHAIPTIEVRPASYFDADFSAHLSAEARLRMEELQDRVETRFKVCVQGGDPADVVRQAALSRNSDLVIIARGAILGGLGRLRTHAYSIINKSPAPVLSV